MTSPRIPLTSAMLAGKAMVGTRKPQRACEPVAMPEMLAYYDQESMRFLFANRAYAQFFGHTSTSIVGTNAHQVSGPITWELMAPSIEKLRLGQAQVVELEVTDDHGFAHTLQVRLTPHLVVGGKAQGALVTVHDITPRLTTTSGERANVIASARDAIVFHGDGVALDCNDEMARLSGYTVNELRGTDMFHRIIPLQSGLAQEYARRGSDFFYALSLLHRDGHSIPVEVMGIPQQLHGDDSRLMVIRDLSSRKQQQREIWAYDALTQLPNRRAMMERLEAALALARIKASSGAVLSVNLDQFNSVNKSLGQAAGNQLLQEVARRLTACVGTNGFAARTEGDAFMLVAPGLTHATAGTLAEHVIAAIAEPSFVAGSKQVLCASVGVALFPDHGGSAIGLVRQAEAALLRAKQHGRGQHYFWMPELLLPHTREAISQVTQPHFSVPAGALLLTGDAATQALLFPELIDAVPEMMAYFDQETGTCRFANRRYAESYGLTTQSILGMHFRDLSDAANWAFIEPYVELARASKPAHYEKSVSNIDGTAGFMQVRLTPHMLANGQQGGVLVIVTDITSRSEAARYARESKERQQQFSQAGREAIVFHRQGSILDINEAMTRLTGYSLEDLCGTNIFSYVAPEDRATAIRFAQHPGEVLYEIAFIHREGHLVPVEVLAVPLPSHGEEHRMVVVRDIRLRKSLQQRELFLHDTLTNLPNRRALMERLESVLAQARVNPQNCAVLAVNLDHFKTINNSLGHAVGDQLLKEVAQRLSLCLDTHGFVARTEGDAFALVAPNVSLRAAEALAKLVIETLSAPTDVIGTQFVMSASVGIALFPEHANTAAALVRQAEAAQALAKQSGRGHYQVCEPGLLPSPIEALQLEYELRIALKTDALVLHYQPVIELASGRATSVEALVRWQHPTRGLLSPAEFIELAESHGMIAPIGRWVLGAACRQAQRWHEQGLTGLSIAVNVSAIEFRQRDVAQEIAQVLNDTGLSAQFLEIELTETVLMHRTEALMQSLYAIKALGVRISIDDFGTGYSSLNYLKRYPLDKLKIDRSFVMDTPQNTGDVAIVTAVMQLAHSLKLQTVAEGVGNEMQRQLLKQLGCDFAQGYWLARPMSASDATQWLLAQDTPNLPT